MILHPLPRLRYAEIGEFSVPARGNYHCKTVPFYIFAHSCEGHYEIEADGEFAVCEEGGAFFVPPNIPLKIWHYPDPASGVIHVRFVHFVPEDPRGMDPFYAYKPRLAITRRECAKPGKILTELLHRQGRDKFLISSELLRLLSLLHAYMDPVKKAPSPEILQELLMWIREHASEGIHTSDLERITPFSRSKLFSLFQSAAGMSPGECILRERIRYAAQLMLGDPGLSVKEVSDRCGWKTAYHFSRLFRKVMGDPPGRYVKKAKLYSDNL